MQNRSAHSYRSAAKRRVPGSELSIILLYSLKHLSVEHIHPNVFSSCTIAQHNPTNSQPPTLQLRVSVHAPCHYQLSLHHPPSRLHPRFQSMSVYLLHVMSNASDFLVSNMRLDCRSMSIFAATLHASPPLTVTQCAPHNSRQPASWLMKNNVSLSLMSSNGVASDLERAPAKMWRKIPQFLLRAL